MKTEYQTHDLSLPAWGPYTKQYSGISHIPAANDGVRFDLPGSRCNARRGCAQRTV